MEEEKELDKLLELIAFRRPQQMGRLGNWEIEICDWLNWSEPC